MGKTKLKVYGWQGHRSECPPAANGGQQTREIVAAPSKAAAARAAGKKDPRSLFNFDETGNQHEIEIAMAEPGTVFWRPLDHRKGTYLRDGETVTPGVFGDGPKRKKKAALTWKDESSYAQGERGKVDPKAWGLTLESEPRPGAFRRSSYILVHRYVGCDGWFLTCRDLGLDTRELGDISADEAKQQAVDIVAQAMSARIETLQAHLAQLKAWSDG